MSIFLKKVHKQRNNRNNSKNKHKHTHTRPFTAEYVKSHMLCLQKVMFI